MPKMKLKSYCLGLIAKANTFADALLKRLSSDHFAENQRIIGEFEGMRDILLSQPSDTAEVCIAKFLTHQF